MFVRVEAEISMKLIAPRMAAWNWMSSRSTSATGTCAGKAATPGPAGVVRVDRCSMYVVVPHVPTRVLRGVPEQERG
jgi:hypothetical protein